jgi:predicted permease
VTSVPGTDKRSTRAPARTTQTDAIIAATSEILFVVLPLVVVALVDLNRGKGIHGVLASPEWSFAAAVLFGQSIVKIIAVATSGVIAVRASLLGTIAIVIGLAPSLLVLSFVLNADHAISTTLTVAQLVLFAAGVAAYLWLGAAAHGIGPHSEH